MDNNITMITLNGQRVPKDYRYYGQWAKQLTKDLGTDYNVFVNAILVHPTCIADSAIYDKTNLPPFIKPLANSFRKNVMWTSEEGELALLYLGMEITKLKEENTRGKCFHPQCQSFVSRRRASSSEDK
eukprot:scaffold1388_cov267-Chaetoceros_neogracile.AAC.12